MDPWPHQVRSVRDVFAARDGGHRRICLTIPTGGGKTWCASEMARLALRDRKKVALYTNRKMMVEQISDDMIGAGLYHGIRAADHESESDHPFQICSIQTENRRLREHGESHLHKAHLVLVDEGHLHTASEMYDAIMAVHLKQGATIVQFTATPLGMATIADVLIVGANNSELRTCGALVPAIHYAPDEPDYKAFKGLSELAEITEEQNVEAMAPRRVWGSVWDHFNAINPTRKPSLLFAPGVEESIWYAEEFTRRGIPSAHIDGDHIWLDGELRTSSPALREEVLARSKDGRCIVVSNRYVLREGINAPWLAHGIFATVFGSIKTYLQSGGRLLRSYPGLDAVTLQDHGGNWWRFGSLNEDRRWHLSYTDHIARGIRAEALRDKTQREPFLCPKCQRVWISGKVCACGHSLLTKKKSRPVITVDGNIREMTGDIFRKRRVYTQDNGPALWEKMYHRARSKTWNASFAQAFAKFGMENFWQYPAKDWWLMPVEPADFFRKVSKVPYSQLTRVPDSYQRDSNAHTD